MNTWLLLDPQEEGMIYPDQLYHHGVKGQKWGIRRFQPYGPGQKVKGGKEVGIATKVKQRVTGTIEGIKQHRAAKKEAKAIKKAEAEYKAQVEHQLSKQQAIEKGTIEDLAKFKGELTNEEYGRAFMRLQNEKKMEELVAANQKTAWDTVDKGMEIVTRLGNYAATVANAKTRVDAMSDAFNKKKNDAQKERDLIAKNKFLTSVHNITELNEGVEKHKITPQEYNTALNLLANKKVKNAQFGSDFEDQNERAAREQAAREQAERTKWAGEQAWKQYNRQQAWEAWSAQREAQKKARKEANAPKDGQWRQDDPSTNNGPDSGGHKGGGYRGEKWGKRPASSTSRYGEVGTNKTNQLLLTMKDQSPSSYGSDKRSLKGAKSGPSGTVKNTGTMKFGDKTSFYKKSSGGESDIVKSMRNTVANTQQEHARQRELDKKRHSKLNLKHSALDMTPDELFHHGIKGQKWGVRRFQDKNGRRTAAGKEREATRRLINSKKTITEGHSYSEKPHFTYKVDLDTIESEERVFSDGRVIYPAIATVIKDFENAGKGNPYPGPKGFDGLYDRVNPGYGEPGTTNNCPFVGVAMEVASRGYGVVARRSLGGAGVGVFAHYFKGADTQKCDTWDEMLGDLNSMPDGSSGVLQGYYGDGLGSGCGGHTLHWRKEGSNMIVADGQCHRELSLQDTQKEYGFGSKGCFYTRLDNCEPNWDALAADGVLGVDNSARRISAKNSSSTVIPGGAWYANKFYGYDDVRAYQKR